MMTRDIISLYNEVMETKRLLCSLPELKRIEFLEKNTDKNMKDLEHLLKKLNGAMRQVIEKCYEKN